MFFISRFFRLQKNSNRRALCSKTNGCSGPPKWFVLKHLYVHFFFFLIRKIKAIFLCLYIKYWMDWLLGELHLKDFVLEILSRERLPVKENTLKYFERLPVFFKISGAWTCQKWKTEAVTGEAKQEGEANSAMSGTWQVVCLPSDASVQLLLNSVWAVWQFPGWKMSHCSVLPTDAAEWKACIWRLI